MPPLKPVKILDEFGVGWTDQDGYIHLMQYGFGTYKTAENAEKAITRYREKHPER
jgi:hypothetical protein